MEGGEEDDQGENGWMIIHEVSGMKLAELRDVMAERKHWRRMVKTVARTRRVDSTRLQGVQEKRETLSLFLQQFNDSI